MFGTLQEAVLECHDNMKTIQLIHSYRIVTTTQNSHSLHSYTNETQYCKCKYVVPDFICTGVVQWIPMLPELSNCRRVLLQRVYMYVHSAKQQLCVHHTSVKQLQIPRYNYKQFLENTYFPSVHSFCKLMRSTKSHIGRLHNAEYMYIIMYLTLERCTYPGWMGELTNLLG